MAPSCDKVSIFCICAVLSGVSLGTITVHLLSFKLTSATLVMVLSAYPLAIEDRVFMEHGTIANASNLNEPLLMAAVKSSNS